ncbi:putative E3 ubiquitin-protein ligase UBR7 [Lucilia cuprina]|uniref:putative E3 ubiquitin-protein ligase UBR7 n=1 Tax=Lucilia cuprina TaxID=7375 RepID=UPI001F053605|nr:putative E3 ubiquitin-protein ligase UBR7 [Lucilia cuprina]
MENVNSVDKVNNVDEVSTNPLEESSVTMLDVLEEEKELEEEYAAVLGASDEKSCTYILGPVKRQALYSCLTCCPDARNDLEKCAGICLACSYHCHENHELVELYTKRNFRCDCPTERTGVNRCTLNAERKQPEKQNVANLYNQNFQGLYCTCHRPYPDPERTTDELMLQCVVCEDWFHLQHLNAPPNADKLVEACSEMICGSCMDKHTILQDYTGLALKTVDNLDETVEGNLSVVGSAEVTRCDDNDDNKLKSDLDKSISEIMNMSDTNGLVNAGEEPSSKRQKLEENEEKTDQPCRRPNQKGDYEKGPTFWGPDWKAALCRCTACMYIYESEKIEFLLDPEDSAKSYEERGIKKHGSESSYEQGIRALASIDRVQQIDVITEYNRMKDKLKEYLQTFVATKKVVTEEDINRFFAEMRNEKNVQIGLPYMCR